MIIYFHDYQHVSFDLTICHAILKLTDYPHHLSANPTTSKSCFQINTTVLAERNWPFERPH